MKLFYAPGACSLADHIALREAKVPFEYERVDLKRKTTASGQDFTKVNPKGYVPALVLDGGEIITENVAVLDWIALQDPSLGIAGQLGRTRILEALAYIATEIHKSFHPFFADETVEEKARAGSVLNRRLQLPANHMRGDYLFGDRPTVADFYLFVMLLWAERFDIEIPVQLAALRERILARPAVRVAMEAEGWMYPAQSGIRGVAKVFGNA